MKLAGHLRLFRRLALVAAALCAVVVVLGGWVRLSAAGLGCPDWPTCYGHLSAGAALENHEAANAAYPNRPVEYGKAVREMVHRYAAGTLVCFALILAAWAWIKRDDPAQPVAIPLLLIPLLGLQAALGMLTVTWLLKPLIVTLHLLGGLATLTLLWWLYLKALLPLTPSAIAHGLASRGQGRGGIRAMLSSQVGEGKQEGLRRLAIIGLLVLGVQIALGGWTSSNYAAVACPDFPTCQDSYWPHMNFREAFVLWRGLGIDYEGGVLEHPARVAIHFVHRLGALVTTLVLGTLAALAIARGRHRSVRLAGVAVAVALAVQLAIGIAMVARGFPLTVAAAHNVGAALLLLTVVTLLRHLSPRYP